MDCYAAGAEEDQASNEAWWPYRLEDLIEVDGMLVRVRHIGGKRGHGAEGKMPAMIREKAGIKRGYGVCIGAKEA